MDAIDLGKVKIPAEEYASEGNGVLGIRGAGKTSTATYIAEQLLDAGIPFIAFDPIGVWKFLRVAGKGKAYPVVVAGGRNGDLPLDPKSAPEIVRAAMRENIPLVLDLYDINLSKGDWKLIVEQCVRLLLYENGDYGLRHLFIEEAAEFVPQRVGPDQGRVYAEIEKLARMGGNALLGYTLINQRAEEVNKAVLELCDCLVLHRQKGRNSLTALGKWLDIASAGEEASSSKAIVKSLPLLEPGEAWVWTQGTDQPVRTRIPLKQTAYPDRRALSGKAAERSFESLDVSSFVQQLTSSLAKQREEPKKQRKAEPERHLADITDSVKEMETRIAEMQEALSNSYTEEQVQERVNKAVQEREAVIENLRGHIRTVLAQLGPLVGGVTETPRTDSTYVPPSKVKRLEQRVEEHPRLSKAAKRIFATLAAEYPDFPDGMSRTRLSAASKYVLTGGSGLQALNDLKERKFVMLRGSGDSMSVAINPELL